MPLSALERFPGGTHFYSSHVFESDTVSWFFWVWFTTRLSFGLLRFFVCCSGVKRYFFNNGYHVQAIVAMVLAIIPSIPGYIESVILNGEDDTAWYTPGPTHPRIATPPPKRLSPAPRFFWDKAFNFNLFFRL